MDIEVELFGQLLLGQPRIRALSIEKPITAQEVAIQLGLNPEDVGLVAMNGAQQELDALVTPGCRLCFFPPMSGG